MLTKLENAHTHFLIVHVDEGKWMCLKRKKKRIKNQQMYDNRISPGEKEIKRIKIVIQSNKR